MTPELQEAFNNPDGHTLTQFLDIWDGVRNEAEVNTKAEWDAVNDPTAAPTYAWDGTKYVKTPHALDVNVTTEDNKGAIQLSSGATVAAPAPVNWVLAYYTTWGALVHDVWHNHKYSGSYVHDRTESTVIDSLNLTKDFPFTASATTLIDGFNIRFHKTWDDGRGIGGEIGMKAESEKLQISILNAVGEQVGNVVELIAIRDTLTTTLITGLGASVRNGSSYVLRIRSFEPPLSGLQHKVGGDAFPIMTNTVWVHEMTGTAAWKLPINDVFEVGHGYAANTIGYDLAGKEGYQATGSFYRSFVLDSPPTADGEIIFRDVVPSGTSYVATLYHTSSKALYDVAGVTGWTSSGVVVDGDVLAAATNLYIRLHVTMAANPANDETPSIERIAVRFSSTPLTIGTVNEVADEALNNGIINITSIAALDSVTSKGASINPSAVGIIDGITKCKLLPEPEVHALIDLPKGRHCRHRRGVLGISDTITTTEGSLLDVSWNGMTYDLQFEDTVMISKDAKFPKDKADVYNAATTYDINVYVAFGRRRWKSLAGSNTGNQPDISPTWWLDSGTVWTDVLYTSGTHLIDILLDIIKNHLNIPDRAISFDSFDKVKALYPLRTIIKNRLIDSPISIKEATQELAFLLESHFVKIEGKIALIAEPPTTASTIDDILVGDIVSFKYRRGRQELKNIAIFETDYEAGVAYDGVAEINQPSITETEQWNVFSFIDKWNMDKAELSARALSYVNKHKDGRALIEMTGHIRLSTIPIGSPVLVDAPQLLPPARNTAVKMFILSSKINGNKTDLKLMEI